MPITPVGYAIARSTASELTVLQQQLAEVDPNDPQAIMQLQTKIAEVQQQIAQVEKEPGPRGQDATLYMGTVETLPPGSAATATMVEGHLNLGIPEGLPGQDAVLELGSVTTGSQASAELVDGKLNLSLPAGADGKTPTLAMGTVTTGAAGSQASASIVDNKLNLTVPTGPNALASIAAPTVISPLPALGTAYQVTKTSNLSVVVEASYTVTLASTMEDIIELRVGTDATVATGGGVLVASWRASFTGIGVMVGAGMADRAQLTAIVPGSMYWALRRTKGTASTVVSAVIQPLV